MTDLAAWDGQGTDPDDGPPDPLPTWEEPPDVRPVIQIAAGQLPRQIRECIAALARDPNCYQRAGDLCRIVREPERIELPTERAPGDPHAHVDLRRGGEILLRPGTPRIAPAAPVLLERAAVMAAWARFDARRGERVEGKATGAWVPADPNPTVVKQIAVRRDYPGVRPLRGILETPCLGPSGRPILTAGYDDETGHVLLPSCNTGHIVDNPSREQAGAALRYLWTEIACDFPFRGVGEPSDGDPDRVLQWTKAREVPDAFVGVAVLLTLFARLAIHGAIPAGLFEAAGQGAGKSLQIHTVALVATGRPAGVATFPAGRDGRPDEAELEKVLMGYALSSARIVAFDNIRGHLSGSSIERALTAVDAIEGRVLGTNEQRSLPWYAALMFSGNNMVCSDDVAQRSLHSRVESPRENPRMRPSSTFRHPDLLGAIKAQRPRLVRAALVILRSYLAARDAGVEVPTPGTRGSFEAWSRIVPGALLWAGGPNILDAFPGDGRGGDEEGEAHAALMRLWPDGWQGQRASVILELLFRNEREQARGEAPPDGMGDARAAVRALTRTREGQAPSAHGFGMRLYALRGKIRDGRRIDLGEDKSAKVRTYSVCEAGGNLHR